MTRFRRYLATLGQSSDEARADNIRSWACTIPEATPIREVEKRKRCKVAGVITNIRIDPREGTGSIEATFTDGTGSMGAKWLGRHRMAGIRLGMGLILEGVIGQSSSGRPVILNPDYVLVPGPEQPA